MPSSLAAQLAQGASLNSALLSDRSKRKWAESYLFTGREADQHDLDSIHALGVNGFIRLKSLNPALSSYEDALFSDSTKGLDRTLLNASGNAELDSNIAGCLRLLGPYLMDAPTGKVIEWLVRRFRINEFNIEDVLALFIPYHESPHFAQMVTILHINKQSKWGFLFPFKTATQHLPRTSLVAEMTRNTDLARFATSLLPTAIENGSTHRALIAWHTSTMLDFIATSKSLSQGELAFILPALLEPLSKSDPQRTSNSKDIILGNYVLLSALSQKVTFSAAALKGIVNTVVASRRRVALSQCARAVLSICAPQEQLEKFSDATVKTLLQYEDTDWIRKEVLAFAGAEKVVNPLIPGLLDRLNEEPAYALLETVLTSPDVPEVIVDHVLRLVLDHVLNSQDSMPERCRILSLIQQRHPDILQKASQEMISEDEDAKEAVEQLILSLSIVQVSTGSQEVDNSNQDMIIASSNADASVRTIAVRNIYELLEKAEDNSAAELESINLALLTRIHDSSLGVLETLYSQPSLFLPILSQHKDTYLSTLSAVLLSSMPPSRQIIRLHLTFLCNHFCTANPVASRDVFEKVLFGYMLFSKPRQRTAQAVWEILGAKEAEEGVVRYELLGGCVDAVQWEMGRQERAKEGEGKGVGTMGKVNLALASKIAENIIASNDYSHHLNYILTKLQDPNPHVRHLGYLTARALLGLLSGEHQVEAAHRLLNAMKLNNLDEMGDFMAGVDTLHSFLTDDSLGSAVVLKPSSLNTTRRLQTAILALLPVIVRPANQMIEWIFEVTSRTLPDSADSRGARYAQLVRKVYKLTNSSPALPVLTSSILRALFINLGDDSLVFLAGIWISTRAEEREGTDGPRIREAALLHAAAFLAAHDGTEKVVDFQTILPVLLVALQDAETGVRRAAVECIMVIRQLSEAAEASSIYNYEAIYGSSSSELQFLEWQDFKRYVAALVAHQDHLVSDSGYAVNLHQIILERSKIDSKKEASYKQRLLCYILSHVKACTVPRVCMSLLRIVESVSHQVKAEMLLPSIRSLTDDSSAQRLKVTMGQDLDEYCKILLQSFDVSLSKEFNNVASSIWPVYLLSVQRTFGGDSMASARLTLARNLQDGLFASLSLDRQSELCQVLLATTAVSGKKAGKDLLSSIIRDSTLVVRLFHGLTVPTTEAADRASKRIKYDNTATLSDDQNTVSSFILLGEIISTQPIPGSPDLLVCLLETLGQVVHCDAWGQTDKSYLEQLLMSSLEKMSMQPILGLTASSVRLDVLVELVRAADSPQIFNQVLLLMAAMARLAPEAVLHNIMPIFTFMGSNVFHRDDAYSFSVVQKTIDSIVPVMASSLKSGSSTKLEMFIASRDFLRIFVDAASHIPRHRRASFFAHLVDVLGAEDFLAPLCMLFIEKAANRIVRQNMNDLQATLSLPIAALEHCAPSVQLETLSECLIESQRLLHRIMDPNNSSAIFLDSARVDDKQSSSRVVLYRRRARSLAIFVGQASQKLPILINSHDENFGQAIGTLVSRFLELIALQDDNPKDEAVLDVIQTARTSFNHCLNAMHAIDFVHSVATVLDSNNSKIMVGALDIFSTRLPEVADDTRHATTVTIKRIIKSIEQILAQEVGDESLRTQGFVAIKRISESACEGEENLLLTIVPQILKAMPNDAISAYAATALPPMIVKLGPRVLPYFRDIIEQSVNIVQNVRQSAEAIVSAINAIVGLLDVIPNLWGSGEVTQVLETYLSAKLDMLPTGSSPMNALMKSVTKKLPSKLLLTTMSHVPLYTDVDSMPRIARYFDVLKRALRAADRSVVSENLKPILRVFLDGFDIRQRLTRQRVEELEATIVGAFAEFVAKLNETAFRPIFRKLHDWAFEGTNGTQQGKMMTFCHIYEALLDQFKSLMTPYMSFLLSPLIELLQKFSNATSQNEHYLWRSVIVIFFKTFSFDEGGFWRDDKLRQIVTPLVAQIPVCLRVAPSDGKSVLQECFTSLVDAIKDDALLKKVNLDVLMHTRSDDPALRIFALECSEAIWKAHGSKLLGFVTETSTFMAECAEDENDSVVTECRRLKDTVENIAGKIDEL